ncbi:MAG: 5'-methylthioadenosine phosphorylase [Bacteroidetes bacterium]|jgi:5'-methylthioadenosine phosphorylase|nr:5'-methylthioadenosine phosphorylase [Bacteroidota bacterium]NBC26758.1 5'-methylthioadenosine phosphorylase [Bacteroidota bacterium]
MNRSIAVFLGSAFETSIPEKLNLEQTTVETEWGRQEVYETRNQSERKAYVLVRHGVPHRLLPNQINYRAQSAALKKLGCGALLINSSVGVLDPDLPLYKPMLVTDLMMPENRLPDGSTCTMFPEPSESQGHLLIKEGLFSRELNRQLADRHETIYLDNEGVNFVYAGGPRSKTPAENRMWAQLGGQVNSMTLAPEVVLANELEIPCAALVVGAKYSVPGIETPQREGIAESLVQAREATEKILIDFIEHGEPVPFANQIYRY